MNTTTNHKKAFCDKKVAVIWTRVSTKEQADNNLSLRTQENACRKYAVENGIEVDCIKGKTNESAKTEGKHFREMISYVYAHKRINTIIVYSLDRFSRTGPEAMVTKEYLRSHGINLISVTQPIDSNNAAGTFMENIIFLFSQFENNLRKEKCIAGMAACLEDGYWYSAPPYGYRRDYSTNIKHQLVIDEKGELIRKAFIWKAYDKLSDSEIADRLSKRGLHLSAKKVSGILHNPFYYGKIKHKFLGDKLVDGKHQPLIDEELFLRANQTEFSEIIFPRKYGVIHTQVPLKKHVLCAKCGKYLTGYNNKKKDLWYYKCNSKGCNCNTNAKDLHKKYHELLKNCVLSSDCAEELEKKIGTTDFADKWKRGSLTVRQTIQEAIFPNGVVWDKNTGTLKAR